MFCPSCGLEDRQSNQFCRACGSDLRVVRRALAEPDGITLSATTAREEIGRALAARVREAETAVDMKIIAEDVLPQIEKFLESPEARRLRRIRIGTIGAAVGLGITLMLVPFAIVNPAALFMPGIGLIVFFIGLAVALNGWLFTVPPKTIGDRSRDAADQLELDRRELDAPATNELVLPESNGDEFSSVTEHTTRRLKEKQPARR